MLIGKEHSKMLEKIAKIPFKKLFVFTVAFSLIILSPKLYQYELNVDLDTDEICSASFDYP